MDCDTFERVVLDRVFMELDELTMGSAQRHVAHCSRCRTIEVGLRATREACRLPQVSPMEGFTECVLAHEKQLHSDLPVRQRLNRAVSMLAAYAMRPQPTMAVLLLLMIGASLFLVRTRPGERDIIQVTERGVPEVDQEPPNSRDTRSTNSTVAGLADASDSEATSQLEQARALRNNSGCSAALESFEVIRHKYSASDAALAAAWEAAECYVSMDRKSDARTLFETLAGTSKYGKRAKSQLDAINSR